MNLQANTVTFQSDGFQPVMPEQSQVNPGRYGAELAFWLCAQLARQGVVTSYPHYEDWGWFLEYLTEDGDGFWLCCGNLEGSTSKWSCYLQPKRRGLFGRYTPDMKVAASLLTALDKVLTDEPSIWAVEWSQEAL